MVVGDMADGTGTGGNGGGGGSGGGGGTGSADMTMTATDMGSVDHNSTIAAPEIWTAVFAGDEATVGADAHVDRSAADRFAHQ